MKKILGIVVLGLMLNNCAPKVFRSHGPEGGVISIDMFALHKNSPKKIQEIADIHCKKYGKNNATNIVKTRGGLMDPDNIFGAGAGRRFKCE